MYSALLHQIDIEFNCIQCTLEAMMFGKVLWIFIIIIIIRKVYIFRWIVGNIVQTPIGIYGQFFAFLIHIRDILLFVGFFDRFIRIFIRILGVFSIITGR